MCNDYCHEVDRALSAVRAGDFGDEAWLEGFWTDRWRVKNCPLHRLRVQTILWDAHQGCGQYQRAAERLRDNGAIEEALGCLDKASRDPKRFAREFPKMARDAKSQYKLWRQRVMAVLAHGYSAFQLEERGATDVVRSVASFLKKCLDPLRYESNGARARLYFFRGIIHESNYQMAKATRAYDLSVHFCKKRAAKELARREAAKYETERSFVVYCLGKMELRLGQLDFDSGRLTAAKRHASEAGLLLRCSKDPFLPHMADLLWLKTRRYEEDFLEQGWRLVEQFEVCAWHLAGNLPCQIEAKIEAIKTSVYLLHFELRPPNGEGVERSLPRAQKEIEAVIGMARESHPRLTFDALLVKARTLNRMQKFQEALDVVEEAEQSMSVLPRPLLAEALFVRGKIHTGWSQQAQAPRLMQRSRERALEHFQNADSEGHASLTFRISCKLQMAELHLELGHGSAAEALIAEAKELSRGVEHTFLNRRLEKLRERTEGRSFHRWFEKKFDLKDARDELEKSYLLFVSRLSGYRVEEFPEHFAELRNDYLAPGLNYDRLMTLLKRHFDMPERPAKQNRALEP
jgi:hypothetical protein